MESKNEKIQIVQVGSDKFEIINEIQSNDGFEHSYPLSKERFTNLNHRGECFFVAFYDGKAIAMISVDFEIQSKITLLFSKTRLSGQGYRICLINKSFRRS